MASKTMVQCCRATGGREVDSQRASDCNCATPAEGPSPAGQLDDACHLYVVRKGWEYEFAPLMDE